MDSGTGVRETPWEKSGEEERRGEGGERERQSENVTGREAYFGGTRLRLHSPSLSPFLGMPLHLTGQKKYHTCSTIMDWITKH